MFLIFSLGPMPCLLKTHESRKRLRDYTYRKSPGTEENRKTHKEMDSIVR